MVLVKKDLSLRVCVNKKWAEVTQNSDGSYDYKCETKALKDSSGLKIICGGDSIGVLLNLVGKDGDKGDQGVKGDSGVAGPQGDPGEAGKSCTAEILADFSGMKMICGGDSVGVIRNGNDGDNGANGAGCSLKQLDETQLQIKCGNDSTTFFVHSEAPSSSASESSSSSVALLKKATVTGTAVLGPFENGSVVTLKEMRIQGDSLSYTGREFTGEVSGLKGNFVIPDVSLDYPYAEVSVTGKWRNEVTGKTSTEDMTLYALTDLSNGRTEVNVNLMTHLEYARIKNLVKEKKYSVQAAKTIADNAIVSSFGLSTDMGLAEDLVTFKSSAMDNTKANATLLAMAFLFIRDNDTDAKIKTSIESFVNDFAADGKWDDANGEKSKMAKWAASYDASGIDLNIATGGIVDIPNYKSLLSTFLGTYYGLGLCDVNRDGEVKTSPTNDDGSHYICKTSSSALEGSIWQTATLVEWECYGREAPDENEARGWKSESGNLYYYDKDNGWREAKNNFEFDTYDFEYPSDAEIHVAKGHKTGSCYLYDVEKSSWNVKEEKEADLYNVDPETNSTHRGYCSDKLYVATSDASAPWRNSTKWENYLGAACLSDGEKNSHRFGTPQSEEQGDSIFTCKATEKGDWEFLKKDVHNYGSWTDNRDGNTYRTITIGNQIWMAENMKYYDCSKSSYSDACDDNLKAFRNASGASYTWSEAKTVCVDGWRLPTPEDFISLVANVSDIADKQTFINTNLEELEEYGAAIDTYDDAVYEAIDKLINVVDEGTNESGFSSMPRYPYWSSVGHNNNEAFALMLRPPRSDALLPFEKTGKEYRRNLFVRCVKDAPAP